MPVEEYDYTYRSDLVFYGNWSPAMQDIVENDGLEIEKAVELYEDYMNTPFVTIYGSTARPEDLAEYIMIYHLTQELNQPFIINIYKDDTLLQSFNPLSISLKRERFDLVRELFY